MSHSASKEQEKAFKEVSNAFKKARKLVLVFYAKSENIVAYTKEADEYIEKDFERSLGTGFGQVPCLSDSGCINDSGADDYGSYRNKEDEDKYN